MWKNLLLVGGCLILAACAERLMANRTPEDAYAEGLQRGIDRGTHLALSRMANEGCGEFYRDETGKTCFRWFESRR